MEPILLNFNEADYKYELRKIETACLQATAFVNQINQINAFRVTAGHLYDLFFGKGESVARGIEKAVRDDLDRAGVQSQSLQKGAVKGDLENFYALFNKRPRLDQLSSPNDLLINEDGQVVPAPHIEARIRRENSHIVETEAGLLLYQLHVKMRDAINEFWAACPGGIHVTAFASTYDFNTDTKRFELPAFYFDYDRLAKA